LTNKTVRLKRSIMKKAELDNVMGYKIMRQKQFITKEQ
jgi:hypothetical protein